ncbi:hypothetical protein NDU88_001537 [Pleurodeles waltl]|uniref:Uncharacterized protein n=1 Tax=Pleurodeles waltl TaxID=8319 RepID=A0AAV7WMZ2_PLEWA|nr:hypothetical protein NDU88_001537 [Pleurodeles waltl]
MAGGRSIRGLGKKELRDVTAAPGPCRNPATALGLGATRGQASGPLPGRCPSASVSLEHSLSDTPRGPRRPPDTAETALHPRGEVVVPSLRSRPQPGPAASRS